VSHENTLSSGHLMAALALAHDELARLRGVEQRLVEMQARSDEQAKQIAEGRLQAACAANVAGVQADRIRELESRLRGARTTGNDVLLHVRQLLAAIRARGDAGLLLPRVEKIEAMIRSGGSGTASNE
jgi:hypothetical protein